MRYLLLINAHDIQAREEEKYELVINIAEGKINIDEIKDWIKSRII